MKPHFRKLLYLPNDEDPPTLPLPTPFSSAAANPPSASIGDPLRPPLTNPPFDSSVGLTVLVLLTALFFMGFFSLYIRRFAEGADAAAASRRARRPLRRGGPRGPSPPHAPPGGRPPCSAARKGLDPAVIRSLPAFAYGGGRREVPGGVRRVPERLRGGGGGEGHPAVLARVPRGLHRPVAVRARVVPRLQGRAVDGGGSDRERARGRIDGRERRHIRGGGGGGGSGVRRSSSWSSTLAWEGRSLERTMSF
ncbi:hypothetical protein EUGRSUZ_J00395 [Eucalyptus grandis]|uniref:Uncharacterized protein n=2 Tax=Eucalyptus grandis TaxID=71139 RepID=A0ACC3J292_EUCGR|nr:hypothetical protein EUGRSUZ_J00395 [Eucalyptus grandis]